MHKEKRIQKNLEGTINAILQASTRDQFDYIEFASKLSEAGFGEKYMIVKLGRFIALSTEICEEEILKNIQETISPLIMILEAAENGSIHIERTNYTDLYGK